MYEDPKNNETVEEELGADSWYAAEAPSAAAREPVSPEIKKKSGLSAGKVIALLLACLLLGLWLIPCVACGEGAEEPVGFVQEAEADPLGAIVISYDTPTLKYTVDLFRMNKENCCLTRIWMKDPFRQIRKITGKWKKSL